MNELAALAAGRHGQVERSALTGLSSRSHFEDRVGLSMKHVPFGIAFLVLTKVFKPTWGSVVSV